MPTEGSRTRPANTSTTNPNDTTAKDRFATDYGSATEREPPTDKAIGTPIGELSGALDHAETTAAALPALTLAATERDGLAGKRKPELELAAELFITALDKNPDVMASSGISSALMRQGLALDGAVTRLVDTSDMLIAGGDNGDLLVSSLLDQLTGKILTTARQQIKDPATPPADRGTIKGAFTDAFRGEDERDRQPINAAAAITHAEQPLKQELTAQQQAAADARLLDAYLKLLKGPGSTATPPATTKTHPKAPKIPKAPAQPATAKGPKGSGG